MTNDTLESKITSTEKHANVLELIGAVCLPIGSYCFLGKYGKNRPLIENIDFILYITTFEIIKTPLWGVAIYQAGKHYQFWH